MSSRILIVEDEREFAGMMVSVLEVYGFRIDSVFCGNEAFDLYQSGSYELMVTDLHVPGMCGVELITRIRELNPSQRILVITGLGLPKLSCYSPRETLHYLSKPFPVDRFVELVIGIIDNGCPEAHSPLTFEDLIRLYALDGKAVILEVSKGSRRGRIYFKRGEVIHAETNTVNGEHAFRELQSWRGGKFSISPIKKLPRPSIQTSLDLLLAVEKPDLN